MVKMEVENESGDLTKQQVLKMFDLILTNQKHNETYVIGEEK